MRKEVELWFRQALSDLRTARNNIKVKEYAASVFFCQQASEKALKALFIHKFKQMPLKTHNLLELAREIKVPKQIFNLLLDLNPEYITTRYPDAANGLPDEMYNKELAILHLKKAEKVVKWVEKKIKK